MASHRAFRWNKRRFEPCAPGSDALQAVTIRPVRADDAPALRRLAILDSAEVPAGALLVAEVAGELWAAAPVSGARAIADPFRPTAALVRLLALRAAQLREAESQGPRRTGLVRRAPWRWRGALGQ